MDIKESKELLKKELVNTYSEKKAEAINVLLNELDKKDKIINEIAEMLVKDHEWFYSEFDNYTKQDFIDYFTKKVSEK